MDITTIATRVLSLRNSYQYRDFHARQVSLALAAKWEELAPGSFTEEYPGLMTANRISVMSRDYGASLAPLPSITCNTTSINSKAAKDRADKRTKIATNYVSVSNLQVQHGTAGVGLDTYGLAAYTVEPDFDARMPKIRVESGKDIYPVWDRDLRTVAVAKVWWAYPQDIVSVYPEALPALKEELNTLAPAKLEVVKYVDADETVVYLPTRGNQVLSKIPNELGYCPYVCVPRMGDESPWTAASVRGAYDELIYPQLAINDLQHMFLEATDKAVRAPIVLPNDVGDYPQGPDAIIRTAQGASAVAKVNIQVPQAALTAQEYLARDMGIGAMSPESRTGNIQASVITGKGIEAASAGFSNQVAYYQSLLSFALTKVIEMCFDMDEKLWPNETKDICGIDSGVPYDETYTPSKDINGEHTVDVAYGFLLGMSPNNALIFILQALNAGLISRDYAARQLPVGMNVPEIFRQVDIEHLRDALLQSITGVAESIPQSIAAGQDPSQIISKISQVIALTAKGEAFEEAVAKAFAPAPPPPQPAEENLPGDIQDQVNEGAEALGGAPAPGGQMPGGAPGQPGPGQPARPSLQSFLTGMSAAGNPTMSVGSSSQRVA